MPDNVDYGEFIRTLCLTCGKPVRSGRSGTMTEWIFRKDACNCDRPTSFIPEETDTSTKDESDALIVVRVLRILGSRFDLVLAKGEAVG